MTSSARDERTLTRTGERWSAEEVDALLAAVSGAPDFATAARFLVAQFADVLGASRGFVLRLDSGLGELRPVATLGYDDHAAPSPHALADRFDPLVVSALSMIPVSCTAPDGAFPSLVAIPFSQSRAPDTPRFIPQDEAERRLRDGCVLHQDASIMHGDTSALVRAASSPCGIVAIEVLPDPEALAFLCTVAYVAGPVLWRIAAMEAHRRSTEQLDEQRSVLTSIVNSLPDPIVIINSDHEIVVQNRRAEHLLAMGEKDSEGRRRAVPL